MLNPACKNSEFLAMHDLVSASAQYIERVDALLEEWIADLKLAPRLQGAMRYSVFNGGKRIRPTLVMAAADTLSHSNDLTLAAAAAVECVHAYSLIHDDLPAMDDDDLRRGKATCHIQFDEATAILAGDALQSLAFEGLAHACSVSPESGAKHAADMMVVLAKASGAKGMVGGQMRDLLAEGQGFDIDEGALREIHIHKTGALIEAAVMLGAMSVNASSHEIALLMRYAKALGLAFQVQDDIIDVISTTDVLGKTQGADLEKDKSTFVSLLGLTEAQVHAKALVSEAKNALGELSSTAGTLGLLADFCIARDR